MECPTEQGFKPVILSHPDGRTLAQHLDEVVATARSLLAAHWVAFPGLSQGDLAAAVDLAAGTHDFAKATSYFQAYMRSGQPSSDPLKNHSLLSACYAFSRAQRLWGEIHDNKVSGAIACAIAGHHGGLPGLPALATAIFRSLPDLHRQIDALDPAVFTLAPGGISLAGGLTHEDLDQVARTIRVLARAFPRHPLEEKIQDRILTRFLASILIEADRTRLAVGNRDPTPSPPTLSPDLVTEHIRSLPCHGSEIGRIREEALAAVIRSSHSTAPIQTMTLPTGAGKTLASLHYALACRCREPVPPKIVTAMPYLSIIEQTDQTYQTVFQEPIAAAGDRVYLSRHSVAPFRYQTPEDAFDDDAVEFLLSTWRAEVVTTTFDQVLYALFSPKSRHLIRFHALLNAILLIDEVQAIPAALWMPVNRFLTAMTEIGQTRVLAMSATQPGVFPAARDCVPDPGRFFARLNRVRLTIRHTPETTSTFCARIAPVMQVRPEPTLVVLNTIAASVQVYDDLAARLAPRPVIYLSARLPPATRSARLAAVQRMMDAGENPVLVATQCIEAGVDIDMGRVYRDFAPLDAIIQICGRCNRHGLRAGGEVEVVRLITDHGRPHSDKDSVFANQIYDIERLESTVRALAGVTAVEEPEFPPLVARYFAEVGALAGSSEKVAHALSEGAPDPSIRTLLRGDDDGESFLIASSDPGVIPELRAVTEIEDRWTRRHALMRLLPRIARSSVSIRVSSPEVADQMTEEIICGFRVAREVYYDAEGTGLSETPRRVLIL